MLAKSIIKDLLPPVLLKAAKAFQNNSPAQSEVSLLRQQAIDETNIGLSQKLLESFQYLVAHSAVSGNPDLHYQDYEIKGAVACTAAEANLLFHLAKLAAPSNPLEIGSYIGWSSAHIVSGLSTNLTCVDPFLETDDGTLHLVKSEQAEARFKENLAKASLLSQITLVSERSPNVLAQIAPANGWDWIFIDGWHIDGQPLRDLLGVLPFATQDALLIFHDLWIADVRDALSYLLAHGWHCHVFDTANYLTIVWKEEPAWLAEAVQIGNSPAFRNPYSAKSRAFGVSGLSDTSLETIKQAFASQVGPSLAAAAIGE